MQLLIHKLAAGQSTVFISWSLGQEPSYPVLIYTSAQKAGL